MSSPPAPSPSLLQSQQTFASTSTHTDTVTSTSTIIQQTPYANLVDSSPTPSTSSLPFPYNEASSHHLTSGTKVAIVLGFLSFACLYAFVLVYLFSSNSRIRRFRIWSQSFCLEYRRSEWTDLLNEEEIQRRETARQHSQTVTEQLRSQRPPDLFPVSDNPEDSDDSDRILIKKIIASDPRNRARVKNPDYPMPPTRTKSSSTDSSSPKNSPIKRARSSRSTKKASILTPDDNDDVVHVLEPPSLPPGLDGSCLPYPVESRLLVDTNSCHHQVEYLDVGKLQGPKLKEMCEEYLLPKSGKVGKLRCSLVAFSNDRKQWLKLLDYNKYSHLGPRHDSAFSNAPPKPGSLQAHRLKQWPTQDTAAPRLEYTWSRRKNRADPRTDEEIDETYQTALQWVSDNEGWYKDKPNNNQAIAPQSSQEQLSSGSTAAALPSLLSTLLPQSETTNLSSDLAQVLAATAMLAAHCARNLSSVVTSVDNASESLCSAPATDIIANRSSVTSFTNSGDSCNVSASSSMNVNSALRVEGPLAAGFAANRISPNEESVLSVNDSFSPFLEPLAEAAYSASSSSRVSSDVAGTSVVDDMTFLSTMSSSTGSIQSTLSAASDAPATSTISSDVPETSTISSDVPETLTISSDVPETSTISSDVETIVLASGPLTIHKQDISLPNKALFKGNNGVERLLAVWDDHLPEYDPKECSKYFVVNVGHGPGRKEVAIPLKYWRSIFHGQIWKREKGKYSDWKFVMAEYSYLGKDAFWQKYTSPSGTRLTLHHIAQCLRDDRTVSQEDLVQRIRDEIWIWPLHRSKFMEERRGTLLTQPDAIIRRYNSLVKSGSISALPN
ncbi:hypothetical protein VKT23_016951 [Stygiomarasmius scandens]|uniref:Uncharacterized protein n=1 Tax=Marasmiellus scandens TaxID=2682957 RepID=A0ABR1IVU6_9AGAR